MQSSDQSASFALMIMLLNANSRVSHRESRSFCITSSYVIIDNEMCMLYGISEGVTFMLARDGISHRLVISYSSIYDRL